MNDPSVAKVRPWRGLWLIVAVLFVFLGTRGLNEPDEGRYAELGREMAAGGSWLVPLSAALVNYLARDRTLQQVRFPWCGEAVPLLLRDHQQSPAV